MENYQCHITINNRTASHLVFDKSDLPWGKFAENAAPVRDIPPKREVKAFVAMGSFGPAGVEGTVIYKFQEDANLTVRIQFDVPTRPGSHNTVAATCSNQDVAANVANLIGSGSTESCTITVVDGR
jgi:hypothetical protein